MLFSPEDGDIIFFRNVICLQVTALKPEDKYGQLHLRKNLKSHKCHLLLAVIFFLHPLLLVFSFHLSFTGFLFPPLFYWFSLSTSLLLVFYFHLSFTGFLFPPLF
jgi:hypothetical protein